MAGVSASGLICVAGVAQYLHRCPRKLGDEGGPMDADGLLRGRRGTFSTSGLICVAGVAPSIYLHRCPRKLGDEGGPMDADGLVTWQVWHFQRLRLDLRGRCGTFSTFIDVRGSLATKVDPWMPTVFCVAGMPREVHWPTLVTS